MMQTFRGRCIVQRSALLKRSTRSSLAVSARIKNKDTMYIASGLLNIVKQVKSTSLEEFRKELEQVTDAFTGDILVYFNNPTILKGEKVQTMQAFCKQAELSKEMSNFLAFMVDGAYMNQLSEVFEAFEKFYGEETSTKTIFVKSAQKLSEDQQFKLAQKLQTLTGYKNVVLKPTVDESLEGGFIVEFDSYQVDMSVAGNREKILSKLNYAVDQEFGKIPMYKPGSIYDPYATGEYARQKDIEENERVKAKIAENKQKEKASA